MQNSQVGPLSGSKYPRTYLHQHLLSCNEIHDHRQTHTGRVSSNKKKRKAIYNKVLILNPLCKTRGN